MESTRHHRLCSKRPCLSSALGLALETKFQEKKEETNILSVGLLYGTFDATGPLKKSPRDCYGHLPNRYDARKPRPCFPLSVVSWTESRLPSEIHCKVSLDKLYDPHRTTELEVPQATRRYSSRQGSCCWRPL